MSEAWWCHNGKINIQTNLMQINLIFKYSVKVKIHRSVIWLIISVKCMQLVHKAHDHYYCLCVAIFVNPL